MYLIAYLITGRVNMGGVEDGVEVFSINQDDGF